MITFILHPKITTGRFTMRHLILLLNPHRFNQPGYKVYRNVEEILFSMYAVGALMTQS